MRLFFSPASPYVRKVMVLAHEAGVADRIELLDSAANPVNRDMNIVRHNPTGKVPTMLLDDGTALFDSRVICEYVDTRHTGERYFPQEPDRRFPALALQALADGLLDAALLARYESVLRPEPIRWSDWQEGQTQKIRSSLDMLESHYLAHLHSRMDIGVLAAGCAVGYMDFRFAEYDWRASRPNLAGWYESFSKRESMQATWPRG